MSINKYIAPSCPACTAPLVGIEKRRVSGTINSYRCFCRNCGSEIRYMKKQGFKQEVLHNIIMLSIFLLFILVIGLFVNVNNALFVATSLFILTVLMLNFIYSIRKFIEVIKVEPRE